MFLGGGGEIYTVDTQTLQRGGGRHQTMGVVNQESWISLSQSESV